MFATASGEDAARGKTRRLVLAAGVAVLAIGLLGPAAGTGAPAADQATEAVAKCKRAIVGGKRVCLRRGQRCDKQLQVDYVAAGFFCAKRLRKASLAEQRDGRPFIVEKNGRISFETALAGFDQGIADLPGVKARKGEIGEVTDATMFIEQIEQNLDLLTPAQRQVFEQWTTPAPDAPFVDPPPAPRADRRAPPTPNEEILAQQYLDQALTVYRNHGFFPTKRVTVTLLSDQGTAKPTDLGYTSARDIPPGTRASCDTFITQKGRNEGVADLRFVIAHEAAHCIQHAFYANQTESARVPAWVKEGTADWLAAKAIQEIGGATPTEVAWPLWLTKNPYDLFRRSYDAVGFFAMLDQAGVDTWARIRSVLAAAATGGNQPAFSAAISGVPEVFFSRWGPGLARDASLGPEWDYTGPFIPRSTVRTRAITNGGKPVISTIQARGSAAGKLEIRADVLTIQADRDLRGLLRSAGDQLKLKRGAYCIRGRCKCRTQANLDLPKLAATTYFGFSDPRKARTVTFRGRSLADYCKKPSPGPAEGGSGSSCTPPNIGKGRRGGGGGGASCPASDGIGITLSRFEEEGIAIAVIKTVDCTAGGNFVAIGTATGRDGGEYRLELGISGFGGFGQSYHLMTGGTDPSYVLDTPYGEFSNATPSPLPGGLGQGSGDAQFLGGGRQLKFGYTLAWRNPPTDFAVTGGTATCVYPGD